MNNKIETEDKLMSKDIDFSIHNAGPLYVDPSHLKPGYHYNLVSNKAGEIEMYKRWGYEVVQDEITVGQITASTSSPFSSAVTIQSKCGQLLVLMACPLEIYEKLQQFREGEQKKREASMGTIDGIPLQNQYGSITITKQ